MKDTAPTPVLLSDYLPPAWLVTHVEMTFRLSPHATRVISRIAFSPNPAREGHHDLRLDGEHLSLIAARMDGVLLDVTPDDRGLTIPAARLPRTAFLWESEVEIAPAANTALEGLYMSNGMYCTQCEAEGFRKITFYPDRPDVMATFRVRIESDMPVMLSNGNPVASGPGWSEWDDPWAKPSYLFALVAGQLVAHRSSFTTRSGREVALAIWVRPGDEDRCAYAMDALKRSMAWDERVYGREYDLDVFNIVAVDDFNMGAMENKGLNIFNSRYVLASPETATDTDYENIERIIAHEYFHNWTGNRITCRDWFQLCLKEGLTVFRDQQFCRDERSEPVKRIEEVMTLRARQFREDNGPLAHPVRPESYVEINNFYTATVYEKGAELIGMLRRLVGEEGYRKALDLYFDRLDGHAATIEDWLAVFTEATGRDLTQFKRWYSDAGTPRLTVSERHEGDRYTLTFAQQTPPTPGQPEKPPRVIPVALGLLNPNGDEVLPTTVLEVTEARQSFTFDNMPTCPVPSLLRGFSAPVILERETSSEERAFLLAHDTDPFNRWDAGRALAKDVLARMVTESATPGPDYLTALDRVARDEALDPAFRALALRLPSQDDMAQTLHDAGVTPDPDRIHTASQRLTLAVAEALAPTLSRLYEAMDVPGPYTPDARTAGCRALRLTALGFLTRLDEGQRAARQFAAADNMTEQLGALAALLDIGRGQEEVGRFQRQWAGDRLVMDKWFSLQLAHAAPGTAVELAQTLAARADFDWRVPNRFRALVGALSGNHAAFHRSDGAGYRFVADWLLKVDPLNPQLAARMSTAFETWRRYDADRQGLALGEMQRMMATRGLSRDMREMLGRMAE